MSRCLEYVWIDASGNTRSKIRIDRGPVTITATKENHEPIPQWNFDGSSTGQVASGSEESDVILRPVRLYPNPFITWCSSWFVLCECDNKDGTPHATNYRHLLSETYEKCKDREPWFGIEQEYLLTERDGRPYQWASASNPGKGGQGPYYCSVGGDVCFGRQISMRHLELCMKMKLAICGTNGEVMASQWEYQIGACDPVTVSDDLWMSRYVLGRVTEEFGCAFTLAPKPVAGWNGSGGHTNFSTKEMRTFIEGAERKTGMDAIIEACHKLGANHAAHIAVYGEGNEARLSGYCETSSIDEFSWGISTRGKSIRIPLNVHKAGCGYLEDRRPAANLDPYRVTEIICRTVI